MVETQRAFRLPLMKKSAWANSIKPTMRSALFHDILDWMKCSTSSKREGIAGQFTSIMFGGWRSFSFRLSCCFSCRKLLNSAVIRLLTGVSHRCAFKGFYSCPSEQHDPLLTFGLRLGCNLIARLTLRLLSDRGNFCIQPSCYCVILLQPDTYHFDRRGYCPTKASSHKKGSGRNWEDLLNH